MKNFEERKAEIFRRSEKRISERKKKRKRIFSICIPLLICIGAYSIFILPAMMPAGSADSNAEYQELADSIIYPTTVKILNNDGNLLFTYTQAQEIANICNAIDSIIIINENPTEEISTEKIAHEVADEISPADSYSIMIVYNTGNTTTYTISENTLFNTSTNNYYVLTDQQKNALDLFRKE